MNSLETYQSDAVERPLQGRHRRAGKGHAEKQLVGTALGGSISHGRGNDNRRLINEEGGSTTGDRSEPIGHHHAIIAVVISGDRKQGEQITGHTRG